MFCINLLS